MRASDAWEGTLALFCASTWLDSKKKSQKKRARVPPGAAAPFATRRRKAGHR